MYTGIKPGKLWMALLYCKRNEKLKAQSHLLKVVSIVTEIYERFGNFVGCYMNDY